MTEAMIATPTAPDAPAQPETNENAVSPSIAAAGADLKAMESWPQAEPEAPTETAKEGESTEGAPDPLAGFQVDAEGRLHRADGTFADAKEIETWNAGAEAPKELEVAAEPAKEPIVVTLRGRDGNEVKIEVDDEAAAEVLRTNHREGMRASDYAKKMQE